AGVVSDGLGASPLSSVLAGPTQPVSSHDAHRLTLQYDLLGAVTPPHISHFASSQRFPVEVITETWLIIQLSRTKRKDGKGALGYERTLIAMGG
ncbi:unnamed protein product, partial [Tetraodon nigroviridis]